MYPYLAPHLLPAIVVAATVWLFASVCSRRVRASFFDSLGVVNIFVALSLALVCAFGIHGHMQLDAVFSVYLITFFFYAGLAIGAFLIQARARRLAASNSLRTAFLQDRAKWVTTLMLGCGLTATSLFFSVMLWSMGSMPDDRVVMAKNLRWLDIIRQGLEGIFYYYAMGCFVVTRQKRFLLVIAATAGASLLSGSKGFLLPLVISYFTMTALLDLQRLRRQKLFNMIFLITPFVGAIAANLLWVGSFDKAFIAMVDRVLASGDVYYYAYVCGRLESLYGRYEFWSYVLHPFTALAGIRGYDHPLGVQLFAQVTGNASGYGPNPQLPVLLPVLTFGNLTLCCVISSLAGAFVSVSRALSLRLLTADLQSAPFLRITAFSVFFGAAPLIFMDIGMFQMQLVGVATVAVGFAVKRGVLLLPVNRKSQALRRDARRGTLIDSGG